MSERVPRSSIAGRRVVVAGGAGFLGREVVAKLRSRGAEVFVPRRAEFDLTREAPVAAMYDALRPDMVFHLAAEVGGIGANQANPGRYFFANMAMALHLIEQARIRGLGKFVQVGTICAYPKFAPIPFRESDIWNGYPEETNAPYGIAKKAALVMLDAYHRQYGMKSAYVLPVNLYGPHDNFDLGTSHVIPAIIRKCVEAVDARADHIECWGTGAVSREFLYVNDAAEGVVRAGEVMDAPEPLNLGSGQEILIRDLVTKVAQLTGFSGEVRWISSKPDGQPRRCLEVEHAAARLGWRAQTTLDAGLRQTVYWYRANRIAARR